MAEHIGTVFLFHGTSEIMEQSPVTDNLSPFDSLLRATADVLSLSDAPLAGKFIRSLAELPDQRHPIEPASVSVCAFLDTALGLVTNGMAPLLTAVENIRNPMPRQPATNLCWRYGVGRAISKVITGSSNSRPGRMFSISS